MVLINPIGIVYVPFEITPAGRQIKRDDLPRFLNPLEIRKFMTAHPRIHRRQGKQVHLQWIGHDESWAKVEYAKEVGKWQS